MKEPGVKGDGPSGPSRGLALLRLGSTLGGAITGGSLLVFAFGAAVGFVPLFGGPGYEHDLASGLFCPSAAAIVAALALSSGEPRSPLFSLVRGVGVGLLFGAISLFTALLHGLRVGTCDLLGGISVYALTAWVGAALGGAWGAVVAEIVRPRKRRRLGAVLLGLALPLGCAGFSVGRFVTSPMIFAYDPFVGYFSGTLYDTVVDPGLPLLSYRAGSAATLVALLAGASLLVRHGERVAWGSRKEPAFLARVLVLVGALAASLGVTASGESLGHYQTRATVAAALGGRLSGVRCDVVFPSSLRPDEARLLLRDCEEEIESVEAALDARGPAKITAFFFRDAAEKRRLMGAEHTYIAKPWREEVYLQVERYPHPVLGHEIAHVVAGSFGRGPFRVAGSLGGLVPNPGLIEGVAVAASPDDEDVSDLAWAKTMMDLGLLPPMRRIFSLGFLGESSSKSYTLAGAFVRFVLEKHGAGVVRAWYGGESIEALTRSSWDELEAAFKARIQSLVVPRAIEASARARFDRPSVFGRRCPHVVDALRRSADGCRDARQVEQATLLYAKVLDKDPGDQSARVSLAFLERRYGDREAGRRALEAIEGDPKAPRNVRDRAGEILADADFLDGAYPASAARYERLAEEVLDEDQARTFEVKALASRSEAYREPIGLFLLGERERPTDLFVGAEALGRARALSPEDPLLRYMIGRNLVQRGFHDRALAELREALARPLPTERLTREAIRQLAICACALGDLDAVKKAAARVRDPKGPFHEGGRKDSVLRLTDRCARPARHL